MSAASRSGTVIDDEAILEFIAQFLSNNARQNVGYTPRSICHDDANWAIRPSCRRLGSSTTSQLNGEYNANAEDESSHASLPRQNVAFVLIICKNTYRMYTVNSGSCHRRMLITARSNSWSERFLDY
jgi:hypothetical protein